MPALNRELPETCNERSVPNFPVRQARRTEDMAVFGRVLEATRANLDVMNRLRELQLGRLEYGQRSTPRPLPVGEPFMGTISSAFAIGCRVRFDRPDQAALNVVA